MWLQKNQWDRKDGVNGIVAVAIDSDKGNQNALKWAIDHLLTKGSTVVLIHVKVKPVLSASPTISSSTPRAGMNGISELGTNVCKDPDEQTKEIFRPYRVFCARKDIQCKDIVLEHGDVAKALTEYVSQSAIEHLVIGSSNKSGFLKRFKVTDIPATVSKAAPDFCTVYVVTKGKIQSMRSASRAAPTVSPLQTQLSQASMKSDLSDPRVPVGNSVKARAYKEFPSSSSRSSSTGRSYVKEQAIVNDLVRQLAEEKEKRTQMEERMNQKMDEMRRWMFEMLQGHGASTLLTPRPTPRPTSMPYLPRGQPSSDVPYPTGSQFHCSPPPDGWHYTTPPGSQYWYGPRPGEFPHFGPPRAPRHDPANSPMSFVDAQPHQAPYIPRLHEENPRPRSDVTASIGFMELLRRGDRQLHEEYLQDGQHYDH